MDFAAAALIAAADAGSHSAAVGVHRTGVEVQFFAAAAASAADARTAFAALGDNGAVPVVRIRLRAEVQIDAVTIHISVVKPVKNIPCRIAAADARGFFAAFTRHCGAGPHQHMYLPLAAVLLDGRAADSALQKTVPADEIQVSRCLAVHLDGRCFGSVSGLNGYAVDKNVRRSRFSVDLDLFLPCPLCPLVIRYR